MPDSGWVTATGHSSAIVNGGTPVTPAALLCFFDSTSNPKVRILDSVFPRRIMYGGSVGLLTGDNDPTPTLTVASIFFHNMQLEFEELALNILEAGGNIDIVRIFWKLPDSTTWKFKLYW